MAGWPEICMAGFKTFTVDAIGWLADSSQASLRSLHDLTGAHPEVTSMVLTHKGQGALSLSVSLLHNISQFPLLFFSLFLYS